MNEPIVFKRSVLIGQLVLVQLLVPPLVAVGMLIFLLGFYGIPFDAEFRTLAVIVAILAPTVIRRPRMEALALLPQAWSVAVSLLLRWLLLLAILVFIGYVTKTSSQFSRRVILTWTVITPVPLVVVSLILHEAIRGFTQSAKNARIAVIAGFNDVSVALVERVQNNVEFGILVKGFFDDRSADRLGLPAGSTLLGGLSDLAMFVNRNRVDVIFIALPMRQVQRVMDLLEELRDTTASIYFVPDIFVMDLIQARTTELEGMPVVAMCETPFQGTRGVVKRIMDVVISSLALVLLSPFLLIVALLVKLTSPGPVIFRQRRYGLDGQIIDVFKFRTMTVAQDGSDVPQATRDDIRVTPVGRWLRRYSVDELPQLLNVLLGDMSLVGPRPHAVAHNEQYRRLIKGYMVRHKVPPGITGLAQVNGCRGETSQLEDMQRRIEYDLEYLRHWSPTLDLRIIFQTVFRVFSDRKAY
jgi:putative colanic acid biosysnthesis UDP-glucose lipid carrier transferase